MVQLGIDGKGTGIWGGPVVCSVMAKPAAHFHVGSGALFLRTELFSNTALIFLRVFSWVWINSFNYLSEKQTEAGRNER